MSCHDGSGTVDKRSPSPSIGSVLITEKKLVTRRFSFVSALGVSRGVGDADHSGPDDASTIGRVTPTTVDLVESRRGSFGV